MTKFKFGDKYTLSKKHKVIFLGYPKDFKNKISDNTKENGAIVIGKGYATGILVRKKQLKRGWKQ